MNGRRSRKAARNPSYVWPPLAGVWPPGFYSRRGVSPCAARGLAPEVLGPCTPRYEGTPHKWG